MSSGFGVSCFCFTGLDRFFSLLESLFTQIEPKVLILKHNNTKSSLFAECAGFRSRRRGIPAVVFPSLLMGLFPVLQEESSVKPDTAGPKSRFGPSTEDLTCASKQVQSPKSCILV